MGHASHEKIMRLVRLMRLLHQGRSNLNSLAGKLGCSPRTTYRYIESLQNEGFEIDMKLDGSRQYFLASDECPCCGKECAQIVDT
jgi:predicted DNA-binding transcriptional regulator YafY